MWASWPQAWQAPSTVERYGTRLASVERQGVDVGPQRRRSACPSRGRRPCPCRSAAPGAQAREPQPRRPAGPSSRARRSPARDGRGSAGAARPGRRRGRRARRRARRGWPRAWVHRALGAGHGQPVVASRPARASTHRAQLTAVLGGHPALALVAGAVSRMRRTISSSSSQPRRARGRHELLDELAERHAYRADACRGRRPRSRRRGRTGRPATCSPARTRAAARAAGSPGRAGCPSARRGTGRWRRPP